MTNLPQQYIIDQLYKYTSRPTYKKHTHHYNFCCPICNEGTSLNKKRRGWFFTDRNVFYCHNCQQSWSPVEWLLKVTNKTYRQIIQEARDSYDVPDVSYIIDVNNANNNVVTKKIHTLPFDSINLFDDIQVSYYKDNPVIEDCKKYIVNRRLNTAINRCKTFYVSLTDVVHKNRLCIPFYDECGKIVFYQTRAIYKKDENPAKYFSKTGGMKSVFGINNIKSDIDYIFICEGPIDSMFIQNGIAICGLKFTELQNEQLYKYRVFKKIWVLDNELHNEDVFKKYNELVDNGEAVFFWPELFKDYKDINQLCIDIGRDSIKPEFFIRNSYSGMNAKMKIASGIAQK